MAGFGVWWWIRILILTTLYALCESQGSRRYQQYENFQDVNANSIGDAGGPPSVRVLEPRSKRCYICSGQYPDRECELYPQYITQGPGQINCSRTYCTTYVRYRPKTYLLAPNREGKLTGTVRPLTPVDFEVNSIARECEDLNRGNTCQLDHDGLGVTCYTTCSTDLCNDALREPSADDFLNNQVTKDEEAEEDNEISEYQLGDRTGDTTPIIVTVERRISDASPGFEDSNEIELPPGFGPPRNISTGERPQKDGPPVGEGKGQGITKVPGSPGKQRPPTKGRKAGERHTSAAVTVSVHTWVVCATVFTLLMTH